METIQGETGVTTKECAECHNVFERYIDHGAGVKAFEPKRDTRICPNCTKPVFVVIVRHPGETL
jgi:hypothetical protein